MNLPTPTFNSVRSKLIVCTLLAAALAALPISAAAGPPLRAHAARAISVSDTAHMQQVSGSTGATLVEEGRATGTLPGTVRARLTLANASLRAGFTIYLRNGTISGHGTARLNVGKGSFASFGGSLTISHGTGHYAHVSGSGGLYGTINRFSANRNTVVQFVGRLHL